MPVGNAQQGVGLGAGDMMITADYSYQYIDWMHSALPQETFEHSGTLSSQLLNLRFTLGINDWWDISLKSSFVRRCMDWYGDPEQLGDELSAHHRTECSNTSYYNDGTEDLQARGGYLGDTELKARYLYKNTGKGFGPRIFFEGGIIIPSSNMLISDPYFIGQVPDEAEDDHRHFAVTQGNYKLLAGFEYFIKRNSYPVFWGMTGQFQYPLKENKYDFLAGNNYSLSLLMLSGPPNKVRMGAFKLTSIGLGLSIMHSDYSKWHGSNAPNSKSTAITPSINFLITSLNYGVVGFSINTSIVDAFNAGDISDDSNFKQEASIVGFAISYRKSLDKRIDKLYWK